MTGSYSYSVSQKVTHVISSLLHRVLKTSASSISAIG